MLKIQEYTIMYENYDIYITDVIIYILLTLLLTSLPADSINLFLFRQNCFLK